MTDLDRLLAEHAIARLITRYVHLNDAGQWEDLAALYTQDGRMNRPTAPDSFTTGREAILAAFQARPPRASRHIVANIVVDVADDGQSAEAFSQILLFTGEADGAGLPLQSAKPPLVGSYQDRLMLISGEWKFAERRGSLDFRQA
ncbi:nuclear transport factor 2 family protein [Novosphingobium humi]|uniref:Nuclear transport factor 2 family protein n=1 Tax=Novosphingobium humi TaxID=2282397 RepID=A0ABY7TU32_9SPHN|nr:nuclear transport factor 2 family protein [Novosphingobium humi]WCT76747.1 nuclear transport factor 2 family protein [Novosphingobium humi]WJS99735.1 nuclear transport factor 2 family protein [Novosphingobium humi]